MEDFKCPDCGAILKDWRNFLEKTELDKTKPFECVGFRCGKRWSLNEVLSKKEEE